MGDNPDLAPAAARTLFLLRSDPVVSYFAQAVIRDCSALVDTVEQIMEPMVPVVCRDATLSALLNPSRSDLNGRFAATCLRMIDYLPAIAEWYNDDSYGGRAARVVALNKVLRSLASIW
jgi:hypothetical protein